MDHLQIPTVVVVGHDWGGSVAWRFTQFYPDRVRAVASFCTPYTPPEQQEFTLEQIVEKVPNFAYQLYLCTPEAERDLEANWGKFFRRIFRPVAEQFGYPMMDPKTNKMVEGREDRPRSDAVPEKVMAYYIQAYSKSGARGGLNWYKQTQNNFKQCKGLNPVIEKPALMVSADKDKALPPSMTKRMDKFIPDLELHVVKGCGHWILWEKPDESNEFLKDFLGRVDQIKNKL